MLLLCEADAVAQEDINVYGFAAVCSFRGHP